MDNNKLYNALLKTQERHRAERAANANAEKAEHDELVDAEPQESRMRGGEADLSYLRPSEAREEHGQEAPFSDPGPNWTMVDERQ